MWHSSTLIPGAGSCDCYLCRSPSNNKLPLSAYLAPPPDRAPRENAYYVVAVSGGAVLSKKPGGIVNCDAVNSDTQRWRVEYETDGENRVAFKNVSDGKWLRATGGAAYGFVDTSDEKQWWVMEEGTSPGSCWLKCGDFDDAYLCNANGSFVDGNAAYTGPKQLDRAHALTWTLRDADAVGYDAKGWRLSVSPEEACSGLKLEEREMAIVEKETRLQNLEEQIAEGQATQTKQAAELASRRTAQQEQVKSLEAREAAIQKQTADLEAREAELRRFRGNSTEISLLKAENDNLHLQLRTSSLEREVDKVRQRSASTSHTERLNLLKMEKAKLRVLLHAEQQKGRAFPSPRKSNDFPSVFNSPSSLATRSTKDLRSSIFGQTSRPGSSSGLATRPATAIPSMTTTPRSSRRSFDPISPTTPTRPGKGVPSSTPGIQQSYDSRSSIFQEDDIPVPSTPTKSSKRISSSTTQRSTPLANTSQTRLSKENLGTTNSTPKQRAVSDQTVSASASPLHAAPSASSSSTGCGKITSKSTPARTRPPRMATLQYGAPAGLLPLSDDGDVVLYSCGHKVYKPPRKLNKTVVGYLYE